MESRGLKLSGRKPAKLPYSDFHTNCILITFVQYPPSKRNLIDLTLLNNQILQVPSQTRNMIRYALAYAGVLNKSLYGGHCRPSFEGSVDDVGFSVSRA